MIDFGLYGIVLGLATTIINTLTICAFTSISLIAIILYICYCVYFDITKNDNTQNLNIILKSVLILLIQIPPILLILITYILNVPLCCIYYFLMGYHKKEILFIAYEDFCNLNFTIDDFNKRYLECCHGVFKFDDIDNSTFFPIILKVIGRALACILHTFVIGIIVLIIRVFFSVFFTWECLTDSYTQLSLLEKINFALIYLMIYALNVPICLIESIYVLMVSFFIGVLNPVRFECEELLLSNLRIVTRNMCNLNITSSQNLFGVRYPFAQINTNMENETNSMAIDQYLCYQTTKIAVLFFIEFDKCCEDMINNNVCTKQNFIDIDPFIVIGSVSLTIAKILNQSTNEHIIINGQKFMREKFQQNENIVKLFDNAMDINKKIASLKMNEEEYQFFQRWLFSVRELDVLCNNGDNTYVIEDNKLSQIKEISYQIETFAIDISQTESYKSHLGVFFNKLI